MKLKLKTGEVIKLDTGQEITEAVGRLENLTYAHLDGIMSNPENIKLQIRYKVVFYAEPEITGELKPCYEIGVSLDNIEALQLLSSSANGDLTYEVIENAAYNYILGLEEYKDKFEIA